MSRPLIHLTDADVPPGTFYLAGQDAFYWLLGREWKDRFKSGRITFMVTDLMTQAFSWTPILESLAKKEITAKQTCRLPSLGVTVYVF